LNGTAAWTRASALALLALALLGAGLRCWDGRRAPCYWDEGYVAQVASDLGRGQRPQAGELWEDGFFPLTASFLAPLSAAPFTRLPGQDALHAIRLWAACLGGMSVLLLGLLGGRLGGAGLGLAAAAALAAAPLGVALGALGLYHALGSYLSLAALLLRLRAGEDADPVNAWGSLLAGGLAWASCYWLWWLPLCLGLSLAWERPRWILPALLAGAGPLALVILAQVWVGGASAQGNALGVVLSAHAAQDLSQLLRVPRDQPLALLGWAGLFTLGPQRRWLALGVGLGLADLLRQRGELNANAYALLPLLPLLCLGLAAGARSLWRRGAAARVLALLLLGLGLGRFRIDSLRALSLDLGAEEELSSTLHKLCRPGELVIGFPPLDWSLRPALRSAEPAQVLAADGIAAGVLRPGLLPSAWASPVRFEDAHFLVSTWLHHGSLYDYPRLGLPALRAELEGWPMVAQGERWGLYANPRFGASRDPQVRILYFTSAYREAAESADALGMQGLAGFARARAASGLPDPPTR
jgi:hypothetical protein